MMYPLKKSWNRFVMEEAGSDYSYTMQSAGHDDTLKCLPQRFS